MKVFISGKVSGEDPEECKKKFADVTERLQKMNLEVVNPHALCLEAKEVDWKRCMNITLKALHECDAIYMLPDWYLSTGARTELNVALELDMMVINQTIKHGGDRKE